MSVYRKSSNLFQNQQKRSNTYFQKPSNNEDDKLTIQGHYDKIIVINLFLLRRYWMFIDNLLTVYMFIEGLLIIIISYLACYWTNTEGLLKLYGVFPNLLLLTAF